VAAATKLTVELRAEVERELADGYPVAVVAQRHGIGRRTLGRANDRRISLVWVRDFAGHRSVKTTETYVHKIENPNVTRAAVEAMAGVEHSWNTEPGTAGSGGE
jgi:hypothetical protein